MVPPHIHNTVGVCNQITFLILYCISSRLVTFLKVTDALIQVPGICDPTVSFKFINFSFQIFFLLFLKCLLASRLTLFRLSTLLQLGSCTHCILACFLWSEKPKYSSPNIINPSAWGHLNPSSYCDVGRLFCGVFKLWSKLQRKKMKK